MRVLHVPFAFYPDPVGGTEVYVAALARGQQQRGIEAMIAAPGAENTTYIHADLAVHRFAVAPTLELRELYGAGDAVAAANFAHILEAVQPDVLHLHAFTSAVSLLLVRAARQRNIPVVFTYHTPTVSCQRGTLLRWGHAICDGRLDLQRCTACTLQSMGLGRVGGSAISLLPPFIGKALGDHGKQGGAWTVLRMTELVALRHEALRTLLNEVDRVVALCNWTSELLARIGVAPEKLTLSRHGLLASDTGAPPDQRVIKSSHQTLRIAFLGRLEPTKGVDLLIAALQALPGIRFRLDIYGVVQTGNERYAARLHNLVAGDARIRFLPPVPSEQVITLLAGYDLLAVPSRWLETGPLVVLEAFAAGIPVVGSNLGGIAELVTHEVDGLLVEPDSATAWAAALARLNGEAGLLPRLQAGVKPPRRMQQVVREMVALYQPLYSAALQQRLYAL